MKRTNTAQWIESRSRWQINVQKNGVRKTFTSSKPGRAGQREANAKADKWLDEGVENSKAKVSEIYDKYMADQKLKTSSGNCRNNETIYNTWIAPSIGKMRIDNVTEVQLQEIIDKAYAKGLSHKSLSNIRGCINAIFKYARFCKAASLNPEHVTIPKNAPRKEKRILQPSDLQVLFSSDKTMHNGKVISDPYINAYRFQVLTGLRPGELIGLRWEDITDGVVRIKRSINVRGEITAGKNDNARREFALNIFSNAIIERQKIANPYEGYVFSPDGFPIKESTYYKNWVRYREYNKLSAEASPYELRHTFVSAVKTLPEGYLKQLVGHSKDMDTYGVYSHKLQSDLDDAAQMVQDIFTAILAG